MGVARGLGWGTGDRTAGIDRPLESSWRLGIYKYVGLSYIALIGSVTLLSDIGLVGGSVCHNFLTGREVTLPCLC